MKGVGGSTSPLDDIIASAKQRMFLPIPIAPLEAAPHGYYWWWDAARADNAIHAIFHNNRYDSSDISAYTEYVANDSIVRSWFLTHRFNPDTSAPPGHGVLRQ